MKALPTSLDFSPSPDLFPSPSSSDHLAGRHWAGWASASLDDRWTAAATGVCVVPRALACGIPLTANSFLSSWEKLKSYLRQMSWAGEFTLVHLPCRSWRSCMAEFTSFLLDSLNLFHGRGYMHHRLITSLESRGHHIKPSAWFMNCFCHYKPQKLKITWRVLMYILLTYTYEKFTP